MYIFKDVFQTLPLNTNINFENLVKYRREVLIREGVDVSCINWEHYVKVLEAKFKLLKKEIGTATIK
jgi:hypothetical protein